MEASSQVSVFGQALLANTDLDLGRLSQPLHNLETYLQEQHLTSTWHHILNNTTSTRPKDFGGPTFPSLEALKQTTMATPGIHTCTICLPCSFEAGDGEEFAVSATAPSQKQATEAACLSAFATLLMKNKSKVLLRQTHWRCSVADLIVGISAIIDGSCQPLAACVPEQVLGPSNQGETCEQDVLVFLRAILQHEGGTADPSRLRTFPDGTKPYLRLGEMLPRGALLNFLQSHSEEFEVLPHGLGRKGFMFRLRSQPPTNAAGVVPGSASTRSGCGVGVACPPANAHAAVSGTALCIEEQTSVVAEMAKVMLGPRGKMNGNKISNPKCKHTGSDQAGKPWPRRADKEKGTEPSVRVDPDNLEYVGRSMDQTLFRSNKQGWNQSWQHLLESRYDFDYLFMNTTGGYRGFELTCVHCQCTCTLSCDKHSSEETLEATRTKWLSFFCQTPLPSSASKPIV